MEAGTRPTEMKRYGFWFREGTEGEGGHDSEVAGPGAAQRPVKILA